MKNEIHIEANISFPNAFSLEALQHAVDEKPRFQINLFCIVHCFFIFTACFIFHLCLFCYCNIDSQFLTQHSQRVFHMLKETISSEPVYTQRTNGLSEDLHYESRLNSSTDTDISPSCVPSVFHTHSIFRPIVLEPIKCYEKFCFYNTVLPRVPTVLLF